MFSLYIFVSLFCLREFYHSYQDNAINVWLIVCLLICCVKSEYNKSTIFSVKCSVPKDLSALIWKLHLWHFTFDPCWWIFWRHLSEQSGWTWVRLWGWCQSLHCHHHPWPLCSCHFAFVGRVSRLHRPLRHRIHLPNLLKVPETH